MIPNTFILTSINPFHLTVASFIVIRVTSFILISSTPSKLTISMFHIIKKGTFKLICWKINSWLPPQPLTLLLPIKEITAIVVSIWPFILSKTLCNSINILSQEDVPIRKNIRTLTMSKRVHPLALIAIFILPSMNSITMRHIPSPLTYITISGNIFPNTITMFLSINPLPVIDIAIYPCVETTPTDLSIFVFSWINITTTKTLIAFAMSSIFYPIAFIMPFIIISTDALSLPLVIFKIYLTEIVAIFVCFYPKSLPLFQIFQVNQLCVDLYVLD